MTVIGRRSADAVAVGGGTDVDGFGPDCATVRLAMALSSRLRWPNDTPNLFEVTFRQFAQNLGVDVILTK